MLLKLTVSIFSIFFVEILKTVSCHGKRPLKGAFTQTKINHKHASANIMLGLIANKRLPNSVLFLKNHNDTCIAVCNWHCELTLKCSLFSLMLLTLTVNVFSKFC
jgi:hypothetical protein